MQCHRRMNSKLARLTQVSSLSTKPMGTGTRGFTFAQKWGGKNGKAYVRGGTGGAIPIWHVKQTRTSCSQCGQP